MERDRAHIPVPARQDKSGAGARPQESGYLRNDFPGRRAVAEGRANRCGEVRLPARKRRILQHFGSPERFLRASREELEAVPGLPGKVARDIYAQVNKVR